MTHEQQLLLQKSQENILAAKFLSEKGLYDIAVSRAYYSMFYLAEAFLIGENLSFSKHAGVISKFGEILPGRDGCLRSFIVILSKHSNHGLLLIMILLLVPV